MASNLRSDENIKMATIPSFIKYGSQDSNAASILQKIFSITENMPGTFIKLKKKYQSTVLILFPSVLSKY